MTTVRGTVHVTGSFPMQRLILRPSDGATTVVLTGPDTTALRRVSGVEVEVHGERQAGGALSVRDFTVVTVEGKPALDGTLERSGTDLVLRTASGRVRLGNPPAALRPMAGARVWITGAPDTGPNTYGVIVPAP
jgi:hypothetical protein